jgi:ankyrin repeat protein
VEGEEPVSGSGIRDEVAEDTASRLDKAHRFAGSVSNKMGGFVQMMYGKTRNKEEDFKAVAAFRQTQGDRDDASSMSSFRISDGIKQVVQNFRASKLSPRNECEEDGSERSEADDETFGNMETQPSHEGYEDQASTSLYSRDSFSQSESTASAVEFSPERAKMFHKMVMSKSALIGDANAAQSVIDTDGSEASRTAMDPDILKQLLLSPTLLTKRHQQAIRAVEKRSWEQVAYLLSANPWLAEMTDLSTNQYLLHKLALYGAGEATIDNTTGEMIAVRHPAAPEDINTDLVRMFPASVHKFDQDGNLPLHMATASANVAMIKLLGDRFPSGASVRNEDGMLPLHLIILACASPSIAALGSERSPTDIIKTILDYFPGAVAVTDNEGNLPIHTAAVALRGHTGVDVVYLLLDEAHRQVQNASGVRFRNKTTIEDMENASVQTETTISPTDSANDFDDVIHCNIVRNAFDETPLLAAIHARVGWEMIEAIARGVGGRQAALWQDSEKNNALHLLVSDRFKDPAAALSILKVAREAATVCNEEGMLPIEVRTCYSRLVSTLDFYSDHAPLSSRLHACRCFRSRSF